MAETTTRPDEARREAGREAGQNRGSNALAPVPPRFVDPVTGRPAYGAYVGAMPRVELGDAGVLDRLVRRKRWVYVAMATETTFLAFAVVHTGFASTAFAFAFDRKKKSMLADRTCLAPAPCATVTDAPHADGVVARFWNGGARVSVARVGRELVVDARFGRFSIDAVLDARDAPPPISAIAKLGDGLFNATEKTALLRIRGRARIGHQTVPLDDGFGGWDYTHGLLPRHTRWHWGYGLGRSSDGEPIGFNVVQGFVGGAECAAFFQGRTHPLVEPHFSFNHASPLEPWHLRGQGIDLSFRPAAMHSQHMNLFVVRSHFVQPVGSFSGSLELDGRTVRLEDVPGVVEDQDVLW